VIGSLCGIFGTCTFSKGESIDESLLESMSSTLKHRGPDGKSVFCNGKMGIGVCRLKVMNDYMGYEPIHNEDSSIWAVLDGEIYNHEQLRTHLKSLGHRFYTSSCEEVLPHLYEEYGYACASKINGLFAFALFDENKDKLILVRDRTGVKPLYYAIEKNRNGLIFGSEVKAILRNNEIKRKVNIFSLHDYLAYTFVPAPETMFEGIKKLLPAHFLVCDQHGYSIEKYWNLSYDKTIEGTEYSRAIYDLLRESVKRQLPDNEQVGLFLSGGIDSSTILGLTSELIGGENIKTFSIGCEESSYSELDDARYIAEHFGAQKYEAIINPDIGNIIQKLIYHTDEPLADWSILPTFLVSQLAKKHVNVVLSGDAADDVFAGHERLLADRLDIYYSKIPSLVRSAIFRVFQRIPGSPQHRGSINIAKRFIEGTKLSQDLRDCRWWSYLHPREESKILRGEIAGKLKGRDPFTLYKQYLQGNDAPDLLSKELYTSLMHLSQGIIMKVDRMSMANSLEVRMPFLDYDFLEYSMRIPSNLKLRRLTHKWILKKSMSRILPRRVLRKQKSGFTINMKHWLRNEWQGKVDQLLSRESIKENGFLNFEYVKRLVSQHQSGIKDNSHKLWMLMVFVIWCSMYFDEKSSYVPVEW
jgi:asparagine synthase (glutamine-hydrolysing)